VEEEEEGKVLINTDEAGDMMMIGGP